MTEPQPDESMHVEKGAEYGAAETPVETPEPAPVGNDTTPKHRLADELHDVGERVEKYWPGHRRRKQL